MRFALVVSIVVAGVAAAPPATAADGTPTFTKDVAPIFYKSCIECHRATMFAPMSLTSFEDCLLYTSPSPRDGLLSRMPSSA